MSPMAKILCWPLTLKYASTINLPFVSKLFFNMLFWSQDDATAFPVHTKWQSAIIISPFELLKLLFPSHMSFTSIVCSNFTFTLLEISHLKAFSDAFGPMNSNTLGPSWTRVIALSGNSVVISPASSMPVGPPPIINMDSALLILSFSALLSSYHQRYVDFLLEEKWLNTADPVGVSSDDIYIFG